MCKKNVNTDSYYVNTCKYEHEKNITMLWCNIMRKISVKQIEGKKES